MTSSWTGRAWSCTVRLVVEDDRALGAATADLTALLDRVDLAASRFRPDSALSRANANACRPTAVPRLLVDLVAAALQVAQLTRGAVDPCVGSALAHLGYDRDFAAVAVAAAADPAAAAVAEGAAAAPRAVPGPAWHTVRLDRDAGLLGVPPGAALDLGATAKAYTADLAAAELARRYATAVLVELGGDLAVAGHRPDGWLIQVAEREGADGQLVLVRHGGLTTSTTTVRRWQRGGRLVHHIIDPRTGAPAAGPWRTASVFAASALRANAASTAAIVLGDDALDWLDEQGLPARLVAQDGAVHRSPGWPAARITTDATSAAGRSS